MSDGGKGQEKASMNDREEAVLRFWRDEGIFEKTLEATKDKDPYVFYDGPPFATGVPHHGHLLQSTIKDVIPRYQTMRGRYVRRQWGWDCHGLPIENIIEKELGLKKKEDIEKYGIDKFNNKARESVLTYEREWKEIIPRLGRWVDMARPYKTMDASYTESIWWAFSTLYKKKVGGAPLIYEGYKSMHICPRCETTLAASEVAQGYKDVKDISVYVKFPLLDEPRTALLAWTTTPWTLPGNVALAVKEDGVYVRAKVMAHATGGEREEKESDGEYLILLKEILERHRAGVSPKTDEPWYAFGGKMLKVEKEFPGRELVGRRYRPAWDVYAETEALPDRERGWKVYAADFVTAESGTGIVHIAPAFGEDDMELGKTEKLPFIQHVGMNGVVKPEVERLAGRQVKPRSDDDKERLSTDIEVLRYLEERGMLFAKENITHSYPHCWRCDWPLLNYAASSWFVNVTALKPRLIEENKEISWIPENVRDGRFGKWLEGARDWAISRSRYWGAPIPAWKCNTCANIEVLGSLEELGKKTASANTYVVMRHGESETNAKGIVNWRPEDPYHLTEKGRAQVAATAEKLKKEKIDLIIASPVMRTKETAEIVLGALGIPADALLFDPRIGEVNTGELNGTPIDTYRNYFTSTLEKFTKAPPGGETLEEMKSRLGEFLYEVDARYKGKRILLVTHEYAIWLLDAVAKGATNEEASWMKVEGGDDYAPYAGWRAFAFSPLPHNERYEVDFHRPAIDRISYPCTCGLGTMSRVPDVFDCWFESGAMPFAQFHFMGDERTGDGKLFAKNYPADFIAEAQDQTRGWFYTMLILSVALFDRAAYKSVITTGLILAEDGQKMSKRLKNYPDPMEIAKKYGADALRFYMISSPVVRGEELRFSIQGVDEIFKKLTLRVDNVRAFYEMYAGKTEIARDVPASAHPLDRWIIARWFETHAEVTHHLDTHELDKAARPVLPFVDDLSTWYLRRSRDRFKEHDKKGGEDTQAPEDGKCAEETLGWILLSLARLLSPFTPFLAEDLYRRLPVEEKKASVHLESWPAIGVANHDLLESMARARDIVSRALEARAKAGIKIRQPLARLTAPKLPPELARLVEDEVNVKTLIEGSEISLDTTITPELKEEGDLRDLIRSIQDERRTAGLTPGDRIALTFSRNAPVAGILERHGSAIERGANVAAIDFADLSEGKEVVIGDASFRVSVRKV